VRGPKAGRRQAFIQNHEAVALPSSSPADASSFMPASCLLHACFMPDVGLPVGLSRQGDTVSPREGK